MDLERRRLLRQVFLVRMFFYALGGFKIVYGGYAFISSGYSQNALEIWSRFGFGTAIMDPVIVASGNVFEYVLSGITFIATGHLIWIFMKAMIEPQSRPEVQEQLEPGTRR